MTHSSWKRNWSLAHDGPYGVRALGNPWNGLEGWEQICGSNWSRISRHWCVCWPWVRLCLSCSEGVSFPPRLDLHFEQECLLWKENRLWNPSPEFDFYDHRTRFWCSTKWRKTQHVPWLYLAVLLFHPSLPFLWNEQTHVSENLGHLPSWAK